MTDLQLSSQAAQLMELHQIDSNEISRLEEAIEKGIAVYNKTEQTIRDLKEENQKLSFSNRDLQKKLHTVEIEKQETESDLSRIRGSRSYRIGRAVTYLPRRIRQFLR